MRVSFVVRALALLGPVSAAFAQTPVAAPAASLGPLTVEKIMRDPAQWIGTAPSNIYWGEDGKRIYFNWNPDKNRRDSLYAVAPSGGAPRKISFRDQLNLPPNTGVYDQKFARKVYEKEGDIYLLDLKTNKVRRVTNTAERESDAAFALQGQLVSYTRGAICLPGTPSMAKPCSAPIFARVTTPRRARQRISRRSI
ncbi:hypothetical protein [Hymenobacter radiodurans]|uniref:hypothetical protein n=1 Tax=Hymenobacter radiodurans TaxID=2496028 RepID=UPI001F0E1361|nr:hypothetical protein [Hymenobacter radiodurans]